MPRATDAAPRSGAAEGTGQAIRRASGTDWRSGWWRIVPYVFAVTAGIRILGFLAFQPEAIGFDARLYTEAARLWLAGGDPWSATALGVHYAAPPPTLLAFAPFTLLDPVVVSVVWIAGSFALAAWALRSLGMPMWWLAFWPIVDGAMVGNPDVAVLALLVGGRGRLGWLAPVLKVYAILPLLVERRWGQVALAGAALAVSGVVLPWGEWVAQLPAITANLAAVAGTTSVYGHLPAMAVGAAALLLLGVRRAGWLAVPLLWPHTQVHYLAMSVPALSPQLAIAWTFPHPAVVLGSTVFEAIRIVRTRRGATMPFLRAGWVPAVPSLSRESQG